MNKLIKNMKAVNFFLVITYLSFFNIIGQTDDKTNYVLENFNKTLKTINKIEYYIQRIDTFTSGHVWNKNGYALIEKVQNDSDYGYHFFGENISVNHISIYDGDNYTIDKTKKKYDTTRALKGSPGEQMVSVVGETIFAPVSDFKDVLVEETNQTYKIKYTFENDTMYNVEDIKKTIELDKETFIPLKISKTSNTLGNLSAHHFILSNLKTNSEVTNTVKKVKRILDNYSPQIIKKKEVESIVNTLAPKFVLPKLLDPNSISEKVKDKITLIDFWEVWCGPCIASLPKIEKIFQKYSDKIDVLGIVTNDIENAKKMVLAKNITFESLIGNETILKSYRVNSFPRYILIDRDGKIKNEYHGFSNDIENDIIKLLEKN